MQELMPSSQSPWSHGQTITHSGKPTNGHWVSYTELTRFWLPRSHLMTPLCQPLEQPTG
jgi:hypothetical protein